MMCPCCGQSIPANSTVIVSLDNNTVTVRGQCVKLCPREAEIVYLLVKRMPTIVTRSTLVERVWGLNETEGSAKCIDVHINKIRRKLLPLGLKVETVWSRGFRLSDLIARQQVAA